MASYDCLSFGINTKEPPLIGLYSLHNSTDTPDTPDSLASVLSSLSATVATTLPNFPLATPTYTTPAYAFNTSVSHAAKGIVTSGLATSTYQPIIGLQSMFNATALPALTPSPTLVTLVVTNSAGFIVTSTSTFTDPEVTLGVPPGWNAGSVLRTSFFAVAVPGLVMWMLVWDTDIFSFV